MAGVSLGEYIRRRRMSRAAEDLQAGEKVLDTALRYGYQSPTAFNRAFQAVHGVPPSAVREPGRFREELSASALYCHDQRSGRNGISDREAGGVPRGGCVGAH